MDSKPKTNNFMITAIRDSLVALTKLSDENLELIYQENEELFNICLLRLGVPISLNSLSGAAARYTANNFDDFDEFDIQSDTSNSSKSSESLYSGGQSSGTSSISYTSTCTQTSRNSSIVTSLSGGERRPKRTDKHIKAKRFLDKLWDANTTVTIY